MVGTTDKNRKGRNPLENVFFFFFFFVFFFCCCTAIIGRYSIIHTAMGVDYVVICFDMEVQPLFSHNAA